MKFHWFRRQQHEEELNAEIRSHLDSAIRDRIARGETPDEARAKALREFGNVGLVKEVTREMWGWGSLEQLRQDLRFGLRVLRKNPGFSLVAILTLALGIGANTAIFSVVNGVLLRPLPYAEPERLVRVFESSQRYPKSALSPANFRDYREQNSVFESLAGYVRQDLQLTQEEGAVRLMGMRVSSGFFRTLGVAPLLGRDFTLEEELPYESLVVVLSHSLWQRRFQSEPNIVGKAIMLSGKSFTVVGVLPAGFQHAGGGYRPLPHGESVDLWWPMWLKPDRLRSSRILNTIGRLKPGATNAQAEAEFNVISRRLAEQFPDANRDWHIETQSLHHEIVAGSRQTLLVLLATVFCVLLIACANTANLMLARGAARGREMAVRSALGAGSTRLVRQLLTESLLLAAMGGLAGLLLAKLLVKALIWMAPAQLPRLDMIRIDGRILAFTVGLSLLTGLFFGLAPALKTLKLNLNELLKQGARAVAGDGSQRWLRDGMIIAEVALSLVLLVGAGLLLRSFLKLQQVEPGFNPAGVLTMSVALPEGKYREAEPQIAFYQQLVERVSALPGVRSAGVTSDLPWTGYENEADFKVEGKDFPPQQKPHAEYHFISADYLRTIGVPLLAGRWFEQRDARNTQPVILINQSMARKYWPAEDAIGKRISLNNNPQKDSDWASVVGIVGDVKDYPHAVQADPALYWPLTQQSYREMSLVMRTENTQAGLADAVRRELRSLDRDLPIGEIKTLETVAVAAVAAQRFTLLLISLFAFTALTLAAIGIYGVMSYLVAQRTQEFGIRMALGARAVDVMQLVLQQGVKLTAIGVVIGLAGAFALTRLIESLLFGVKATDFLTFTGISALVLGGAALACWLPARRATKVDPLTALRHE